MKRLIMVLVVSALMVVLMATTVSPAFAYPGHGYAGKTPTYGGNKECNYGWAVNNPIKKGYTYDCRGSQSA
jgi:hypothetical protein